MKKTVIALSLALAGAGACAQPLNWNSATVYFAFTDRFANGDPSNDLAYGRRKDAAPARGWEGGDLKGVTAKIRAGYFNDLGVDAIWLTPFIEQVHGGTDEGWGLSYASHGYWARDFTSVDANMGTEADVKEMVEAAHAKGLRVLMDVVMNHTGPATDKDSLWPSDWVRTEPVCTFKSALTNTRCALVKGLPDFLTESDAPVEVPPHIVATWKAEGRYEREMAELDDFFKRTGYPRAPRYYLMKWHADWVRKYGFDGFRADTVKHVDPIVWRELKQVASAAYEDWKRANPDKKLGDEPFYLTAEVWDYTIRDGLAFSLGDVKINYHDYGFDSMINFGLKTDAKASYEQLFSSYAQQLHQAGRGLWVLNYISSHDDANPFDGLRTKPYEAANKLLLSPGAAQIYYGDETSRLLQVPGAKGDANLRSFMNWDALAKDAGIQAVRTHWAKLGRFRHAHPAIGAGEHRQLGDKPYSFARSLGEDQVVVALDTAVGKPLTLVVGGVFASGSRLIDAYSGEAVQVTGNKLTLRHPGRAVLLERAPAR